MSDVFTKRAAKQKLGTVVRAARDFCDAPTGTFGRVVGFRSCGRRNYVAVEWLIAHSETPLPITEFSRFKYEHTLIELPKPLADSEMS